MGASHCRIDCLLACWDIGPGAREASEVSEILLGKGGEGHPLLCKHTPTNPEKKEWRNMAFKVEPVYCCCCCFWVFGFSFVLLSSASNLSASVLECLRKGKDFWNMVADSTFVSSLHK